jgi:hypothetical protein
MTDRYPVAERDWYRSKWAIHPTACEKCGTREAICWSATTKREHIWNSICPACERSGDAFAETCRFDGAGVIMHVREVPAMVGSVDDGPEITVHVPTGRPMMAGVLGQVAGSFYNLAKARRSWALHPPVEWRLERRDDGRVWAPSDPNRDPRWWRGDALPLRQTELRSLARKRAPGWERKCFGCTSVLDAGMTAWRADPAGHLNRHGESTHGWHSDGLRTLWCPSCVAAVKVAEESTAGEVVVRHMRVIEGGAQ